MKNVKNVKNIKTEVKSETKSNSIIDFVISEGLKGSKDRTELAKKVANRFKKSEESALKNVNGVIRHLVNNTYKITDKFQVIESDTEIKFVDVNPEKKESDFTKKYRENFAKHGGFKAYVEANKDWVKKFQK